MRGLGQGEEGALVWGGAGVGVGMEGGLGEGKSCKVVALDSISDKRLETGQLFIVNK